MIVICGVAGCAPSRNKGVDFAFINLSIEEEKRRLSELGSPRGVMSEDNHYTEMMQGVSAGAYRQRER